MNDRRSNREQGTGNRELGTGNGLSLRPFPVPCSRFPVPCSLLLLVILAVCAPAQAQQPAPAPGLGETIPFTPEALQQELAAVRAELDRKRALPAPTDPKDADALKRDLELLERDAKVLESSLDIIARTDALPADRRGLEERALSAEREAARALEETTKPPPLPSPITAELVEATRLEESRFKKA